MALKESYQYRVALDIVKTGIKEGAIKLIGPVNGVLALENANADAAYITALLESLSQKLPPE